MAGPSRSFRRRGVTKLVSKDAVKKLKIQKAYFIENLKASKVQKPQVLGYQRSIISQSIRQRIDQNIIQITSCDDPDLRGGFAE